MRSRTLVESLERRQLLAAAPFLFDVSGTISTTRLNGQTSQQFDVNQVKTPGHSSNNQIDDHFRATGDAGGQVAYDEYVSLQTSCESGVASSTVTVSLAARMRLQKEGPFYSNYDNYWFGINSGILVNVWAYDPETASFPVHGSFDATTASNGWGTNPFNWPGSGTPAYAVQVAGTNDAHSWIGGSTSWQSIPTNLADQPAYRHVDGSLYRRVGVLHTYAVSGGVIQGFDSANISTSVMGDFTLTVTNSALLRDPVADFAVPAEVVLGQPLTLSSTSYDPDDGTAVGQGITSWLWSDGQPPDPDGTASSITYNWTTPGVKNVTLQVTDNEGVTKSVTKTVNVVAVQPHLVTEGSWTFGSVAYGTTVKRQMTFRNTGHSLSTLSLSLSDLGGMFGYVAGTQQSFNLAGGESRVVEVEVRNVGDRYGDYEAAATLTSNDPTLPKTTVPLTATIPMPVVESLPFQVGDDGTVRTAYRATGRIENGIIRLRAIGATPGTGTVVASLADFAGNTSANVSVRSLPTTFPNGGSFVFELSGEAVRKDGHRETIPVPWRFSLIANRQPVTTYALGISGGVESTYSLQDYLEDRSNWRSLLPFSSSFFTARFQYSMTAETMSFAFPGNTIDPGGTSFVKGATISMSVLDGFGVSTPYEYYQLLLNLVDVSGAVEVRNGNVAGFARAVNLSTSPLGSRNATVDINYWSGQAGSLRFRPIAWQGQYVVRAFRPDQPPDNSAPIEGGGFSAVLGIPQIAFGTLSRAVSVRRTSAASDVLS